MSKEEQSSPVGCCGAWIDTTCTCPHNRNGRNCTCTCLWCDCG